MSRDQRGLLPGEIRIEFDVHSFGRLLQAIWPDGLPPMRTDGIPCHECGLFVTWKAGACPCGWEM